jgi:hypothetical protein
LGVILLGLLLAGSTFGAPVLGMRMPGGMIGLEPQAVFAGGQERIAAEGVDDDP